MPKGCQKCAKNMPKLCQKFAKKCKNCAKEFNSTDAFRNVTACCSSHIYLNQSAFNSTLKLHESVIHHLLKASLHPYLYIKYRYVAAQHIIICIK